MFDSAHRFPVVHCNFNEATTILAQGIGRISYFDRKLNCDYYCLAVVGNESEGSGI